MLGPSSFGSRDRAPIELLEQNGFTVIPNPYGRKLTKAELVEHLDGVDALLAGLETVDREVLEASGLQAVSRCGSGISNVDVGACEELGVAFRYTPYGPTLAVAEMTLCMMLALLRQVVPMASGLACGKWDKRVGLQLTGKTVVIVGFGRIGRRTASLLAPFAVEIIAVDPAAAPEVDEFRVMRLEDALPLADIVVLHMSGEEQVLGAEEFRLMKPGAFLLNAARGLNIDEAALQAALDEKRLAGAWLDSFCREPYDGPLCGYDNVLLTPHVGSYTAEGRFEMEMEAARNLIEAMTSVPPSRTA